MNEGVSRQVAYMEIASLIGQRMLALSTLEPLLAEVTRMVRDSFRYDHCHVLLVDEQAKEVVLKAASGCGAEQLVQQGLRLKIGKEGIAGWVAYTGQTMLCNDVARVPQYYRPDPLGKTRAELAVPLHVGKRIVGVLDVQTDRRDAFGKEDVIILQILGNQLGIAIENARLFETTKRRYEALVALYETTPDVIAQLDMDNLLDALLRRGVKLLGAQAGAIFRYDAQQDLIYNVANYNTDRDWAGVALRPGEGIIGQIILEEIPLLIEKDEIWTKGADVFVGVPYTAIMGAPLRWQDQIIGGMMILGEHSSGAFDSDDLWLLKLFADLASIAIKNAELFTQVTDFNEALELKVQARTSELHTAQEEISAKAEQLRALLVRTLHLQEEERARIARDMHDGVVQLITAARYELKAASVAAESASMAYAPERLSAIRDVLNEIEQEIRRAIYNLTPPALNAVGLIPALQTHADDFQQLTGISTQVRVIGSPCQFPPSTGVAVFRLVEEALHNVATHASATSASVTLEFRPELFCVNVQDDGLGFDFDRWMERRDAEHLGLLGMQERASNLGGKMEVVSEPGQGTLVKFCLPLQGCTEY